MTEGNEAIAVVVTFRGKAYISISELVAFYFVSFSLSGISLVTGKS